MTLSNVHITPQVVQAVRDAVDIVDIASDHTRLKRSGRSYTGLCPLHKEKTPSFTVDPEQGLFYCFGCGQGGDAIKLHMQLSGDDFPAAIESLASRYGIPLPTRSARRGGDREEIDVQAALEAAEAFFQEQLKEASHVHRYLEDRRVSAELIERYGIGYAPASWDALHSSLTPAISLRQLEAAGLIGRAERRGNKPYDRFRNRLMFPIRNAAGRLVGFGGRAMAEEETAKYVNSPETDRFQKRHLLFGLHQAKRAARENGRLLIVEGYFDQLAAVASGIEWAVASMGTSLTPEQARLAARFVDEVVVGYDGDAAGEEASRRALPVLLSAGLTVRRLRLDAGEDPDSMRLRHGESSLAGAVSAAADAVEAEIERLVPGEVHREPSLKARSARAVADLLGNLSDPTLRFTYGRIAAARLGLPAEELLRRRGAGGAKEVAGARQKRAGSPVRSLEERVLQLLAAAEDVDVDMLPPPDAFLDAECRNIFALFCDLYRKTREVPAGRELLGALGEKGTAVDRLAQLLVERPVSASSEELDEALRRLGTRWRRQRLRELSLGIDEAQRAGDSARLETLLAEKTALSLALHRPDTTDPRERE